MNKDLLTKVGFEKEAQLVEEGKCPFCEKTVDSNNEFRDELSLKEFTISGLCQGCQDNFFGKGE